MATLKSADLVTLIGFDKIARRCLTQVLSCWTARYGSWWLCFRQELELRLVVYVKSI